MTTRTARWRRAVPTVVAAALAALFGTGLVGPGSMSAQAADHAEIDGDGSTWSYNIVNQWMADVQPMGMQVQYNPTGSSAGRKSFAADQDDFAISEIPFQGTTPGSNVANDDTSPNRPYAYLPIVAGGTSLTYHVTQAGQLMRDVRLSGQTIAKIFTGQITNWNDPAISADNNGRTFPDLTIHPVGRSDGSGTTAQFTRYLSTQFPSIWTTGMTSYFPSTVKGVVLASGSDGVMNSISAAAGNGYIGYVEYSYPTNKNYPVVKLLNAAGYYTLPTDYDVAVALTAAQINTDASSQDYLTQILNGVYNNPDPRTYAMSSYSYLILPVGASDARMTTAKRQTLADFLAYGLCTGQSKAGAYGYSPLPLNLVQAAFTQVARLKAADPNVDLSAVDVTSCGNPTFVAGDLTKNHLAEIAPQPAACDKAGAGPCLGAGTLVVGTTTGSKATTSGSTTSSAGTTSGTTAASTAAGTTGVAADSSAAIDPETGLAAGSSDSGTTTSASGAVATTIAARPATSTGVFAGLSAAELLAVVLVPGMIAVRRRRAAKPSRQS